MRNIIIALGALSICAVPSLLPSTNGAEPKLHRRSFRPIVPINQAVRNGSGSAHSQSMTITIPPPSNADTEEASFMGPASLQDPSPNENLADNPPKIPEEKGGVQVEQDTKEVGASKTPPVDNAKITSKESGPTLSQLRAEAHALAGKKLTYIFGADNPDTGGLDCSSTVQLLLKKIGIKDVPRTSYDQYAWLKRKKLLDDVYGKNSSKKLLKKLSPGDLIFWGGTWNSGHRVSHVMIYMGFDPKTDKHYVFGARSRTTKGLTGAGVDIFELDTERGHLVAHGKIPGLVYE